MSFVDDNHLIKLISDGDRSAFTELYNRYSELVYNTAFRYVKNIQAAEEVTQDVFINVFRYASNFKAKSTVKTWVYRITINTSLNAIKKSSKNVTTSLIEDVAYEIKLDHNALSAIIESEDLNIVLREIDSLPERQKTSIILSYIEDLPRQEVADIMELSLKATESLLQRAKQKLKTSLNQKSDKRRIIK